MKNIAMRSLLFAKWSVIRACATIVVLQTVGAQTLPYWLSQSPSSSPSGRYGHDMAYDAARQRVVLFGGVSSTSFLADTWEWDGSTWAQRIASGPSSRYGHAMVYDSARQVVVLFGGEVNGSSALNDTWEWDGATWTERFPATSPSPRYFPGMAYDSANQRTIIHGGMAAAGAQGDTWEWDGVNWSLRSPVNTPGQRWRHAMAYDSARQRIVLFGGWQQSSSTWEWDGSNWAQMLPATYPQGETDPSLAYDSLRQVVVMFGRNGGPWSWDGTNWQPEQLGPAPRAWSRLAYDPANATTVLFGGYLTSNWFNDTWLLQNPVISAGTSTYGSGCGSPPLTFAPTNPPVIGQTASATISNAPSLAAGVSLGLSNTFSFPISLPFELSGVGMPGCYLLQSNNVIGLVATPVTGSTLQFQAAIPFAPALLNQSFYLQAYSFAPGVNPAQVVTSNGIAWLIGDQ